MFENDSKKSLIILWNKQILIFAPKITIMTWKYNFGNFGLQNSVFIFGPIFGTEHGDLPNIFHEAKKFGKFTMFSFVYLN